MSNLLLNFPEGFSPNITQVKILKQIDKALADNKKFVVVNAPTGAGKSFIGKTLANFVRGPSETFRSRVEDYTMFGEDGPSYASEEASFGVFALTITKALQDQYKNTFLDTGVLKGKSNYQCDIDDTLSVDIAPCVYVKGLKNDCWKANRCPYYNKRNDMLLSKFSSLNYSMFFSLPDHLKKRKVLVCDEGSELEEQLVSQFTCEVDIPFLIKADVSPPPFPALETPAKVLEWIKRVLVGVQNSITVYEEYFKNNKASSNPIEFSKKKNDFSKLSNLGRSLEVLMGTYYDSQYIIERLDKNIKFTPLKVDKLSKFLFDYADHVIILSATIIDPPNFAKTLGIGDYVYVETSTTFDPKKAPIHIMAKQKLNFSNLKQMLPKLVTQIEGIMDHHKNDKGIIHTHTQFITDFVRENVSDPSGRLLCREAGVRNEELLDLHETSSDPTVLVSPSMTYGVDLKDNLGRFQIILKAPWLPTKDVRVEKLMKIDKDWYSNQMIKTLVQASGRVVRSEDDWGTTYILDGSIFDAIQRNKKKLPSFFLDRIM